MNHKIFLRPFLCRIELFPFFISSLNCYMSHLDSFYFSPHATTMIFSKFLKTMDHNPYILQNIFLEIRKIQVKTIKSVFLLAGHKVDFIALCGSNKSIFYPLVEKKDITRKYKYFSRIAVDFFLLGS